MNPQQSTPMLEQYRRIKAEHPEAILFFRMGDFYEMFFEDAKVASKLLGIALTTRDKERGVPLCGVPYHAADQYIARLIEAGLSVAVCEQVEDPKLAKGIVRREVIRVITPGTAPGYLPFDADINKYLMAVCRQGKTFGLAYCDLSTGEFRVTEVGTLDGLSDEVRRIGPREIIINEAFKEEPGWSKVWGGLPRTTLRPLPSWLFDFQSSYDLLLTHFGVRSLEGFGCQGMSAGIMAAGVVLHYLRETQKGELAHIVKLSPYFQGDYLVVDATTKTHLEITESFAEGSKKGSLLGVLDRTATPMGARKLRHWLEFPLTDPVKINARLDAVWHLKEKSGLRKKIQDILKEASDLERLSARIALGSAGPRELVALKNTLALIPKIKRALGDAEADLLKDIGEGLEEFHRLVDLIERALVDNPPASIRDGGAIREGYSPDLDQLRAILREGKDWIVKLEARERERTGIPTLKVKYNNIFGYFIEVTRSYLDKVPQDFVRKQTLVGAERFITAELKEYENKVLNAEDEISSLESNLFNELREETARYARDIARSADLMATLDVIASLAEVGHHLNYTRPVVDDGEAIVIKDGRHPVVEYLVTSERFVPNDAYLDLDESRLLIITGPNMAGKSTYIRQVALIVLMAQMGSLVPAREAKIGVVDRIFTRVGASDNLARGQSTFMVEMSETANILNNATKRSLIILDEIGRGTSTFDGISIAWSVAEYISDPAKVGAKTLFATHYHELTELALTRPGIKNYNVAVKEWGDEIIFLRKIMEGGSDRSYGIQVARLAGMPGEVLNRSKEILARLEQGDPTQGLRARARREPEQLSLFSGMEERIAKELKGLDLDRLTPLEALLKLKELKDRYAKEGED
mgnify:CR=1 FL=1